MNITQAYCEHCGRGTSSNLQELPKELPFDIDAIPIHIHIMPNVFQKMEPLANGIHYAVRKVGNAQGLISKIKETLTYNFLAGTVPAGTKTGKMDIDGLDLDCKFTMADRKALYIMGINPIIQKVGFKEPMLFGNHFIYDEQKYEISVFDQITRQCSIHQKFMEMFDY